MSANSESATGPARIYFVQQGNTVVRSESFWLDASLHPTRTLADVLARLPDHSAKRIDELLPWKWRPQNVAHAAWAQSTVRQG
ncbi:transposase domain-containing protein [Bradyrhizobium sp. DN5]|uniref:transposase domain-containing protein n=1 Tax=Bradyrhizobium sp. DN5 TaxID=3056950 RepID=UPI0035246F29